MTIHRRELFKRGANSIACAVGASPSFKAWANLSSADNFAVLNWPDYLERNILDDFGKQVGLPTELTEYSNDLALLGNFLKDPTYFDVIIAPSNMAQAMYLSGTLAEIDKSRIPNISLLDTQFLSPSYDPNRSYTLPYFWGTLGLGYRRSVFKKTPTSWSAALENTALKNRIALFDDVDTTMGIALKYLGYSFNSTNLAELDQASELLLEQKPYLYGLHEDTGQDLLQKGLCDVVAEWNGDILALQEEDDRFAYVVPQEGSVVWEDVFVLPKRSFHTDLGHQFINYLYKTDVNAALAKSFQYATPQMAAAKSLGDSYLTNSAIFPDAATLAKCEVQTPRIGASRSHIDQLWAKIRAEAKIV